ncbi:MAG: rhodanese-like domain-containing protein [Planctomycetota bacterium]
MTVLAPGLEVTDVPPAHLAAWLKERNTVVIDVREEAEYAESSIPGAELVPLSRFDAAGIRERHGDRRVVFQCRSGKRSLSAAAQYAQTGEPGEPLFHLAGGILAWRDDGLSVRLPASPPRIPLMGQVHIAAGGLVTLGVALGAFVNLWFLVLAGFIGLGLIFSGATGWCGMARLLGAMPWNARSASVSAAGPSQAGSSL